MGIIYSLYDQGVDGVLDSLLGVGIPIACLIWLHVVRMLGAGDIKLLAVLGSIVGHSVWNLILYSFIVGGILSAIQMLYHHSLVNRIQHFWNYILTCLNTGEIIPYKSGFDEGNTENTLHFSIAILIAYLVWLAEGLVVR